MLDLNDIKDVYILQATDRLYEQNAWLGPWMKARDFKSEWFDELVIRLAAWLQENS